MTAALFSLAHLPPDLPTFLDRFAFGLAASAVVWLTGGLEAAIVLHAVNNVLVFVLAGALGEGVATEAGPGRARAAVPADQRGGGGRLRRGGGAVAAPAAARDAHRGAGPADPRRPRAGAGRLTRRPGGVPPGPEPSGIVFCGAARCHPWGMG